MRGKVPPALTHQMRWPATDVPLVTGVDDVRCHLGHPRWRRRRLTQRRWASLVGWAMSVPVGSAGESLRRRWQWRSTCTAAVLPLLFVSFLLRLLVAAPGHWAVALNERGGRRGRGGSTEVCERGGSCCCRGWDGAVGVRRRPTAAAATAFGCGSVRGLPAPPDRPRRQGGGSGPPPEWPLSSRAWAGRAGGRPQPTPTSRHHTSTNKNWTAPV